MNAKESRLKTKYERVQANRNPTQNDRQICKTHNAKIDKEDKI